MSTSDVQKITEPDGTALVRIDPWLTPYAPDLRRRYQRYRTRLEQICEAEGALERFTRGHLAFGLNRGERFGEPGVWYREWAPGAHSLSLIGDFNNWNRHANRLERDQYGVWSIFLPDAQYAGCLTHGSRVKVHVDSAIGGMDRIPAYIRRALYEPGVNAYTGQYWMPPHPYVWRYPTPVLTGSPRIYEAHVGMATEEERVGTYGEFTERILPRVRAGGYNVVQLMAIAEHPYYASFGYHVSNFYAASSRFGTPEELKELIDTAHGMGLLVLMDLVHSHSVRNVHDGLNLFDGTDHQYFHAGPRGQHPAWDSLLFDYAKWEVLRFLLSNVRFWLEEYRFDGFRFDGVTSMMYLHHGLGRAFGHYDDYLRRDLDEDAITYLQLANQVAHEVANRDHASGSGRHAAATTHDPCDRVRRHGPSPSSASGTSGDAPTTPIANRSPEIDNPPVVLTIAEDVSGMPGLCRAIEEGGIGFDYRLAMGIPDYWIKILKERRDEEWAMGELYHVLTNRRKTEKHIGYAESHDQALVGDKTIAFRLMDADMYWLMSKGTPDNMVIERGIALHKMIRLITFALSGDGYLNFMGNEFGHPEWIDFPREGNNFSYKYARRQWSLVSDPTLRYHDLARFDEEMQKLDIRYAVLASELIEPIQVHEDRKLLSFRRGRLVFVFNFHTTQSYPDYRLGVPDAADYRLVLNTDDFWFGGHGIVATGQPYPCQPVPADGRSQSIQVYIPARSAQVLAPTHP